MAQRLLVTGSRRGLLLCIAAMICLGPVGGACGQGLLTFPPFELSSSPSGEVSAEARDEPARSPPCCSTATMIAELACWGVCAASTLHADVPHDFATRLQGDWDPHMSHSARWLLGSAGNQTTLMEESNGPSCLPGACDMYHNTLVLVSKSAHLVGSHHNVQSGKRRHSSGSASGAEEAGDKQHWWQPRS